MDLKVIELNDTMDNMVFNLIAKYFFQDGRKEHIFANLFLILDWNLTKKSGNCVVLKV